MARELEPFEAASDIPGIAPVHQVSDAGVGHAGAVEDGLAFGLAVRLPDVLDMENRDHHAFGIAQGDLAAAGFERFGEGLRDIEGDRHWPKNTAGELHVAAYALVVGFV